MKGYLIVNGFLKTEKFQELTCFFQKAAKELSIELTVKDNSEFPVNLNGDLINSDFTPGHPDFVLFWDKDVLLARWFEQKGIPVYNSARCIALCDDKRKMHLALQEHQIPVPETMFAPMTYSGIGFTNYHFFEKIEERLGYPMVVKEAYGSFGAQVYLAENRKQLEEIVESCQTTELLFQRFVSNSCGRDIRLQVVGNRVVGSMYRYSEDDFRANITAGGSMKQYEPTEEESRLALRAAAAVEADFAGVDLLFAENGPVVCEVNSNAHFKNLFDCTGVDTAREILDYIVKKQKDIFYAWLVYDRTGAEKNADYIRMHKQIGKKFGIFFELKYVESLCDSCSAKDGLFDTIKKPDFAIIRTIRPELSKRLETCKIPVFNNAYVSEICNDKGKTIRYIEDNTDVPVIPTECFSNDRLTAELLKTHPDCVIKAADGHGGTQVFRTEESFEDIVAGIGTSDFVIQPFVDGPGKDVRVYVIGNDVIGAVERTAADGFRSNFSLGGSVTNYELRPEDTACVDKICRLFSFGMVGIDFIIDKDNHFIFNEIEDVVGARMLYSCNPEINLLERYFTFILDKLLQ